MPEATLVASGEQRDRDDIVADDVESLFLPLVMMSCDFMMPFSEQKLPVLFFFFGKAETGSFQSRRLLISSERFVACKLRLARFSVEKCEKIKFIVMRWMR